MRTPLRQAARLFWRAIRLRCPNCAGRPIFHSWFRIRRYCPVCGLPPFPPWSLLQWGGIMIMVLAPVAFYPFSKTLFLAFDLLFRPATPDELA